MPEFVSNLPTSFRLAPITGHHPAAGIRWPRETHAPAYATVCERFAMPIYHFDLRDEDEPFPDEEGLEFSRRGGSSAREKCGGARVMRARRNVVSNSAAANTRSAG